MRSIRQNTPHSLTMLCILLGLHSPASLADGLADAIQGGKISLQLRPRYEFVQQDGKARDAHALTLRTLLGLSSKPVAGVAATLQFINVAQLGGHAQFNDGANGLVQYPVVVDPALTAVNQAFLAYGGLPDTTLKFGRQVIVLDDARFIGNVDWRQNMQTYDGVRVENSSLPGLRWSAAYITRVKGSYANFQTPVGQRLQPVRLTLLHAAMEPVKGVKLAAFSYLYQDRSQPDYAPSNLSNASTGLRLEGRSAFAGVKWLYTAAYAKQRAYDGGRAGIDARYWHFGGGVAGKRYFARLDQEVLGANAEGSYGLQTPLATKHAFNGWADMFLVTPSNGLKDRFATLGATLDSTQLSAAYHDYHADRGGQHFGQEWDVSATQPLSKQLTLGAKYAHYRARDGQNANYPGTAVPNVNTQKTWLYLVYNY